MLPTSLIDTARHTSEVEAVPVLVFGPSMQTRVLLVVVTHSQLRGQSLADVHERVQT